ncbi:MAG: HEAT repeat domain-containing protein [Treponema sp.]|uniref:HEAT repeat domain-containing protein n=1 Tax=Treponema sp. TaxID=166 RepID=UPI00298E0BC9|nr:HEAT repeat domain-containing protein [Treponema sp.]MCQ2600074.1 HEAT repeat domain-containing protein [Treponema sp.]
MKINKLIAVGLTTLILGAGAFAQSSKNETSVESEYMSSMEDIVITEMANSDQRDNKLVALQYLEAAADKGNVSPDMVRALDLLSGEGISTQSRTKGRLANNYPDIRAKACDILGKVGTEEAAYVLTNVVKNDNEPWVLSRAIHALGEIGSNEDDKVTDTIAFISNRIEVLNPTSSLANEIVDAFEKLLPETKNKKPVIDSLTRIASDYRFVRPVRTKALELLRANSGAASEKKDK